MNDTTTIADRYIAAWNEADPARRRAALDAVLAPGATYVDPMMRGAGVAEIDGLIAAAQAKFQGLRFARIGRADGHGQHVRFSWALGPADGESLVEGTDIARVENGRMTEIVGFLDKVPAGA
jgi:hypothetical protein